jgi:hypothetical protein
MIGGLDYSSMRQHHTRNSREFPQEIEKRLRLWPQPSRARRDNANKSSMASAFFNTRNLLSVVEV